MKNLTNYLNADLLALFEKNNIDLTSMEVSLEQPAVDVAKIASLLGFTLSYTVLNNSASKTIAIDKSNPEYVQRYTVARGIEQHLQSKQDNFSYNLFIPERLLKEVLAHLEETNTFSNYRQKVRELAKKFNVSRLAMEQRLLDLKLI